jgi:hypothetical protein
MLASNYSYYPPKDYPGIPYQASGSGPKSPCGTLKFNPVELNVEFAELWESEDRAWTMIAFRGSNNLGEFSNSATTLRQDTCNLRGPCGEDQEFFYERIQAALKALDGKVRSGSKLILTGHSLGETDFIYTDFKFPITRHLMFAIGGAVATLAALFYRRLGFSEVRLITFGSLRVGDPDWRTAFNRAGIQSYQRFVNIGRSSGVIFSGPYDYQDAATDWPPELFNQYVHVGNEVLLDYGNFRGRRSYSKFLHLIEIYGTTMKRRLDGSGLECTAPPPPQPETSILPPPVQTTVMPPPVQTTVMPPPAQTTMMPPPAQTTAPSKPSHRLLLKNLCQL